MKRFVGQWLVATMTAMQAVVACNWALASDAGDPAAIYSDAANPEPKHWLFFGGLDLWRDGTFLHGGLLYAQRGIDVSGFVMKALGSAGRYRYESGALSRTVTGQQLTGFITPGWRFSGERLTVTGFAGLEAQNHRLTPDDLSAGLRGSYFGARAEVNVWYQPTQTTMLSFDGNISSIGNSYNARLAYGWWLLDRFYSGPEAQVFGDPNYQEMRLGVHVTGWKTNIAEWSAGFGYATDSGDHSGPYVRLGVLGRM